MSNRLPFGNSAGGGAGARRARQPPRVIKIAGGCRHHSSRPRASSHTSTAKDSTGPSSE